MHPDVAVLGAGFAGSLMALILTRIGRPAFLLERGRHPRFAIGESSTPVATLALEELSRDYVLPSLWPLTEYGRWRRAYPHLLLTAYLMSWIPANGPPVCPRRGFGR